MTRYLVVAKRLRERRQLREREMYLWEMGVSLFGYVRMKNKRREEIA